MQRSRSTGAKARLEPEPRDGGLPDAPPDAPPEIPAPVPPPPSAGRRVLAAAAGSEIRAPGTDHGPYVFCDYWASVLHLHGVMRPALLASGMVSLDHFRKAIDRPLTRLPKLRYYILAFVLVPVLFPYRVVYDIMRVLRRRAEKIVHPVDLMMGRYRLQLARDAGGRVRVERGGAAIAAGLIDPEQVSAEVSLFYPTYKLMFAGICSVVLSMGVLPQLWKFGFLAGFEAHVEPVLFSLMFVILLLIFRDLLTALVAPLPIFAVRALMRAPDTTGGLLLASVGFIGLFFVIEWFFLPRQLPPTLFLYVNDPDSELYPYRDHHAPAWLEGKHYWVWRFMALAPAELHKFWEQDWERFEVWIRADGPEAGRLEWVVYDWHYRELWFRGDRLTKPLRRRQQEELVATAVDEGRPLLWILEADTDFLFHAPYVRSISLADVAATGRWGSLLRLVKALHVRPRPDRFERYEQRLVDLEIDGVELMSDLPEHFRGLVQRAVIRMPWDYWRYPLGAASAPRLYLYGDYVPEQAEAAPAADPRLQVKSPRHV